MIALTIMYNFWQVRINKLKYLTGTPEKLKGKYQHSVDTFRL